VCDRVFKVGNRGNVEGGPQRVCSSWTTEGCLKVGQRVCLRSATEGVLKVRNRVSVKGGPHRDC
jgi:hypothetical protein